MSGTTIGKDTNVVSLLDRMMQVESGQGAPGEGAIVLQDGRTVGLQQGKSGDVGPLLALICSRTSHEVAERIIANMGVQAGKPLSHETLSRLHQATVGAFEQRNLELVGKLEMMAELERIDPDFARELRGYGPEIDVFVEAFTAMLQDEARLCARRGEEMREDRTRELAERILRDQKFRKAPLANPRHLARAVQLWSQQKGRTPMRERIQTIDDVRSGGSSFSTVSEMVQQYPAPYTTQEIARRMLDALEKEVEKKR